jgi:hypothetical protein
MDFIDLGSDRTVGGIDRMLESALGGPHGYTDTNLVEVPIALLIVEIAKIAEDKIEWFPRGKWATIQHIQFQIEQELKRYLFKDCKELKEDSDGK